MQRFKKAAVAGILCGLLLAGATTASAAADVAGRVNINAASAEELARLPGIGPAKARAIVEHRATEPFRTPDDLRKVKGIGDKLYEQVKDHVTVGDPAVSPKGRGS